MTIPGLLPFGKLCLTIDSIFLIFNSPESELLSINPVPLRGIFDPAQRVKIKGSLPFKN